MTGNKQDNEMISVIIPSYNHERYIKETIQSIIDQDYQNIELIVIDDGSKDATFSKIKSMEGVCKHRFQRVIFRQQQNQGICITLNKLFSLAGGKFIYMIASDDVAKPNALSKLYSNIKNKNAILAVGDNEIIDRNSQRIDWDDKRNPVQHGKGFSTFWSYLLKKRPALKSSMFGSYESLLKGNYITNGILVQKSAVLKTGGYTDKAPLEDWYMNLQLSKIGHFSFMNEVLFSYRWHQDNTIKKKEKMAEFSKKVMKYEQQLVQQSKDPILIDLFNKNTIKIKHIFQIKYIFDLYKKKTVNEKFLFLKIFNKEILLRSHLI